MGSKFDIAARKAAAQHGRIAWWQLVEEGVDRHEIQRWIESGRLHRVHHGVYAVGHRGRTTQSDYMAAVLACGKGTVLSHRADAHLLRLLPGAPPRPEVTVPTTTGRSRPGIVVHRVARLDVRDTSELDGIPITTVPRVLLDLAPTLAPALLARACHQAWVHHETTPHMVEACIARNPGKPGAAKLRRALGSDVTLSELEDGFLKLLRAHGVPLPRTNIDRAGDKVDCHWPHCGLTVELLSYRYHATRAAFETDVARRRRSKHLAFSYGDVAERGAATIAELRAELAAAGG
jgi:hypothetical protein